MFLRLVAAAVLALSSASLPSRAADQAAAPQEDIALARNSMLLFGGPSKDYPRIGIITWGQGLAVISCESTAKWCQVEADGQRGWVQSSKLTWGDDGQRKVMRKRISAPSLTI
ncbi:MAG: SH3 domain-containing protein [Rhizobium sp.]|nr:SH3 domain-containing protein [Rhizobium sp.]